MTNGDARRRKYHDAAGDAAAITDEALRDELARLQGLDWNKVKVLLPDRADQDELAKLVKAVDKATNHNERVASLCRMVNLVVGAAVKAFLRRP